MSTRRAAILTIRKLDAKDVRNSLRNNVALITGANRGIGLAIAQALTSEGCDLVITGRDQSALHQASKALGRAACVLAVQCDVRDPQEVKALFAAVKKRFHRLDVLVNNAGMAHANLSVANLPLESWKQVIDTNLTGMFLVTHAGLPLMKRGGAIVNNLSIAAKRVFAGSSAYNASKHGALGFTNTLREELRGRGIRVIALLPGATDTAIWKTLWPKAPRKKMISPKTVAEAVVNALTLPPESTLEELTIMPSAGTL
jgi:NAD(P)-dependent dehydrogenase (short-subunit alcohol dehydrogenase family)